jgi:serine/threonine-protein kinase
LSPGPRPAKAVNGGAAPIAEPVAPAGAAVVAAVDEGTPPDAPRTVGRYALHAEIAAGGMATIHIGRLLGPVGFARTVAIKRLHPPLAKDPEFVAMFLDEARLAARIRHPNVVSTLDVVATEGELFVVMEYVPGESLARLLRVVRSNKEIVPVPIAGTIMVGVLHGLHAAHEARDERGEPLRIVHRDVSPHNILVGTDGDAHVIDFGIAKARGRMQVTRQGQIKGKLSYMPGEQLLGQPLDHRADIFAASIVLWESLTGQRLFQGVDDGEVYAKVLMGKVDPPSLHAKGIKPEIDAIVLKGLARDRNQRWATARDMALALEAAIPLAPPSQVGRWVEHLVGESLAERTMQIAGIERQVEGAEGGATSSALVTFGGARAIESHDKTGSRPTSGERTVPSVADRTAPTQPVGLRAAMNEPTMVDRPPRPSIPDVPISAPGLAVGSDAPRRKSLRWLLAVVLLFPVLAYGALREWRQRAPSPAPVAAKVAPAEPHTTAASASPAATGGGWTPVAVPMSVPTVDLGAAGAASVAAAASARKPAPTAKGQTPRSDAPEAPAPTIAPTARPSSASPGTNPGTNGSSCDPPFYIDADGTKRYKRYCAGL